MPDTLLGLVLTRLDQVQDPVLLHREAAAYPTEELEALLSAGIVKETSRALQIARPAHMPAGGDLLVRETAKGLFGVAEEDDYHQPVPLAEDDVRQYEIIVSKLVDVLRQENELEGAPVQNGRRLTFVGERPLPGGQRADVYLSLLNDDASDFMVVCGHVYHTSPRPVVMLVPSSVPLSVENAQLLRSWDVFVSPLATDLNGTRWNLPWDRILTKAADPETKPPRRRGRPRGTLTVTRAEILRKFGSLRVNYGRNPTQQELADNLKPKIEVRTLQAHLTAYDLSWPIE